MGSFRWWSCVLALTLLGACAARTPGVVVSMTSQLSGLEVEGPTGAWAPDEAEPALMETGRWIAVDDEIAYTYVDHQAGLTAWVELDDRVILRRLDFAPRDARVLDEAEVAALDLPDTPAFVARYGWQPPRGSLHGAWRSTEGLAHRWHPTHPDDLLVVLLTELRPPHPEVIWVRVFHCEGLRCKGGLINQPFRGTLQMGDVVAFDATDVPPDRPPPAAPPDAPLPAHLVRELLELPQLAGQIADPTGWQADRSLPPAERLPPIGRWFVVQGALYYGVLTEDGPQAVLFTDDGMFLRTMPWAPRDAELLTDDELRAAGLPPTLEFPGLPPQPEPGTFGDWRVRPELQWLFALSPEPDVVRALLHPSNELIAIRITACDEMLCSGRLVAAVGEHRRGAEFEFGAIPVGQLLAEQDDLPFELGDEMPIAWPKGSPPGSLLDVLRP